MQPVTDPELLAILNGDAPAGPVYGPPPRPPAPVDPLVAEGRALDNEIKRRNLAEEDEKNAGGSGASAAQLRTALGNLDAAGQEAERWGATGTWTFDGLRELLPGAVQARANIEGNLAQIKGMNLLEVMQRIKESGAGSPTQLMNSNVEAQIYSSLNASLDPRMSYDHFMRNLNAQKNAIRLALAIAEGNDPEDPAVRQRYGLTPPVGGGTTASGEPENRWPGVIGQDGKPLPPEGGYGLDPETGEWALYGVVTDNSPPPPSPPPDGGPGFGQHMLDATQNTLAGLAQGAAAVYDFPLQVGNAVERGLNYAIGEGGGALMDMVGLPGAADWWRQGADINEAALSGPNSLAAIASVSPAIERLSPTPEGMEGARFASQLVGGALVPLGPKAVPRARMPANAAPMSANVARDIIGEGERAGVRVMTSDVRPPTTFTGKVARAAGERIPYAGTGGPRAAQQAQRTQAVRRLADDYGVEADAAILDDVAADLTATRSARLTTLTNAKNSVIDSIGGPVPPVALTRTLEAIDRQVRELAGIDATKFAPLIDELTSFGANIASGKTLRQVEENRRVLGALFRGDNLATIKDAGQKAVNAIYGPLREDMGAFIGAAAGKGARAKWAKANEELSAMAGELNDNVFRGVLQSAETTPENVARVLFSNRPSEVRRLVASLSPEGRTRAQAAIIQRAMEKAGDNLSPDRFANEVGRLGRSIGVVFEGADLARIQGLERLLQATKQAGIASAAPPTGVQNTSFLMGASVPMTGGTSAALLGGIGGLARIYESAPVRNLLVGLGRSTPGSKGESQLFQRILKIVVSQSQIRGPAANDVLAASPGRLAAAEQEQN